MENPETDLHKNSELFLYKGVKAMQWSKGSLLKKLY